MCGLVTYICASNNFDAELVEKMRDRLAHRGPDGHGIVKRELGAVVVAMAHRRLSILDLSASGAQPMTSTDGMATIVFNGEIYNFVELKQELLQLGHNFHTTSDTEVLVAAYVQWGGDCASRLNGMFAFTIWDETKKCLFVARDRFGEKPLFYARPSSGGIAFASEMKALFLHPSITPSVNNKVLEKYTAGTYHEDIEDTMFAGVRRVPPATAMFFDIHGNIVRQWRYWIPDYTQIQPPGRIEEKTEKFLALFQESLAKRLRADVPIGTSLSGGLDSSMIVCALSDRRFKGSQFKQNSFSARFDDDPTLSEGEYIDMVVEKARVNSLSVSPTAAGLMQESRALHWHQEEPFLSASIYLQWCVARLAKQHDTTVLLDGQGADEILAGYQYYFRSHQLDLADKMQVFNLIRTTRAFNGRLKYASEQYKDSRRRFNHEIALTVPHLLKSMLRPTGVYAGPYEVGVPPPKRGQRLRRQLAEAVQYNSLPMLLRYADRNAMAFGREGRLPFLDYDLVDWCISLPDDVLIRDGWQKYVMRRAGEGLLPKAVQWRADKVGYAAPLDVWLRGELKEWAAERLFGNILQDVPNFDRKLIQKTWDAHQSGEGDNSWSLWRWISLSEWLCMHKDNIWQRGL